MTIQDSLPSEAHGATREEARRGEVERLDADILGAIGCGWKTPVAEVEFDRIARDVFAHQFRFNPVYRQFCLVEGVSAPADVTSWAEIPAVPTGAFKVDRWATFPESEEVAVFRTSGTSRGRRGTHRFDTLALYNAAIVSSGGRFLFPRDEQVRCLFLGPSPAQQPDSSLTHMFAVFREVFGGPGSRFLFSEAGTGGYSETANALDLAERGNGPVLVAGTAIAFDGTLTALGGRSWKLPEGSRTMLTGGFKGRCHTADPTTLRNAIKRQLGVPSGWQVTEYGMTELSTQFYDERVVRGAVDVSEGIEFVVPPWARVRVIDSTTGKELDEGQPGTLVHYDLANRGSALAVLTSDVGVQVAVDRFALLGREEGTEQRGCSLAADLWLETR